MQTTFWTWFYRLDFKKIVDLDVDSDVDLAVDMHVDYFSLFAVCIWHIVDLMTVDSYCRLNYKSTKSTAQKEQNFQLKSKFKYFQKENPSDFGKNYKMYRWNI